MLVALSIMGDNNLFVDLPATLVASGALCYTDGMNNSPLIVILGPTASGKTGFAIQLAQLIGGEIICADSRTVYRGMDVGTAKPTKHERKIVPHWALDLVTPNQHFTLYDFQRYAQSKIVEIRQREHVPMLVGGSGLYIDSVIYNYDLDGDGPVNWQQRHQLEQMDVAELKMYAINRDIELPRDVANKRRLIRAIERGGVNKKCSQLEQNSVVIGIQSEREELRQRSRLRSQQMLNDGLINETQQLLDCYGPVEPLRRNAYGVVQRYLNGDLTTVDELIDKMVIADGRLVKKQLTWWRNPRRSGDIMWRTLSQLAEQLEQWRQLPSSSGIIEQLQTEYKKFRIDSSTT